MTKNGDVWHSGMYDKAFASETLDSPEFHKIARDEVRQLVHFLGLKPGDQLLDVPCGTGRHSVEFAKRGIAVTSVDISKACLALTRKNRGKLRFPVEHGNMANLKKYRGRFDAVVNLFSSFGYFSTEEKNKAVLKELVSALKPGGKVAIHLINRDWLMKVFSPVDWSVDGQQLIVEARKYDPVTHYNEAYRITMNQRTGKASSSFHRIRLYSKAEMVALMKKIGLRDVRVYGNYKGEAFSKFKSTHPIYVGTK